MRSIFFKLFAWFWLANILVVGILFFAIGPHGDRKPDKFRTLLGDMVERYGQRGLDVLQQQGSQGYETYLADLEQRTGMSLFILNDAGKEVGGRALPEDAVLVADRARHNLEPETMPDREHRMLIAQPTSRPEGGQYVLLGRLPAPPSRFFVSYYQTLVRLLAAVAVAGVLCYGLAHYLTDPLRKLRGSARELAGGNFRTRAGPVVENRHDEIGDLGHDFNFMAERIESLVSTQQRLILDISHELRSPLARLNLALGLAVQRAGPEATSALDRIGRESERLNTLIERMLILARLQHREAAGEAIVVDLTGMVCDIVADAEFEASAHHRDAKLMRCDPCTITGIPHLLRSAIDNVIRNGLRYTAENTHVEISLEVHAGAASHAVIRVRDHGPGVPEDSLARIFQPFCRVGDDRNRQTGGVGLGLAIADQAVRFHGGTITAKNAPDGGLIVELSLPLPGLKPGPVQAPTA
jgi:two-component system sensor histidine kinase CpxA